MVKRSREDFDALSTNERQDSREFLIDLPSSSYSVPGSYAYESPKYFYLDSKAGEATTPSEIMRCSLPPHARQPITFSSFEEYEVHYNQTHVNRCIECRKNFPTSHFLDLHISENHNPLMQVLRDRGEHTYTCFVEGCDRKCSTPQKRRMHLIDKHMFPKDYEFSVINDGIDQRNSMLRSRRHQRRSSTAQGRIGVENGARRKTSTNNRMNQDTLVEGMPTKDIDDDNDLKLDIMDIGGNAISTAPKNDSEIDGIVGAMSSLNFVPPSVSFGRGRGRGGFSKS